MSSWVLSLLRATQLRSAADEALAGAVDAGAGEWAQETLTMAMTNRLRTAKPGRRMAAI
jgi:hypothetical protein